MAYKLIITERAEKLLDDIAHYLIYVLMNKNAAAHLFDEIDTVYGRLETNPDQFPISKDTYLGRQGYREAVLTSMDYIIVFRVNGENVYIMGIYHQLENYRKKIKDM